MELHEIFQQCDFQDGQVVEFPLAFPNQVTSFTSSSPGFAPNVASGGDYIVVPTMLDESNIKPEANKLILAAAVHRKVVVYDSQANGKLTIRLFQLMKQVHRSLGGAAAKLSLNPYRLTDFFSPEIPANVKIGTISKLHYWSEGVSLLNHCFNRLNLVLPSGCTNIVLGVDSQNEDCFVKPQLNGKYGLAILDHRKIILGAY